MKVYQSTVEKLLYFLLALMFIGQIIVGIGVYHILENHTSTIQTVENNQHTNALAIKTYIACLIDANPPANRSQELAEAQQCFDSAPEVK